MSALVKQSLFPAPAAIRPPLRTHRFTVEQYERMTELGFLTPEDRVELLEGWIADKMTQHPPHASCIDLVADALRAVLPPEWILRDQKPLRAGDSVPEPDVAVVRGPRRRYVKSHPVPEDVATVIELADTTLEDDRVRKGRIYARARIPVYWIINLPEGKVEVYTHPRGGKIPSYRQTRDYAPDAELPLVVAGREIGRVAVRDLLPV
jgi:Uma2 family endonuclease